MNEDLNLADEKLVDAWLASGLNRAAFARQQQIPYHQLLAAIRRVEQHSPSAAQTMQTLTFMGMFPARSVPAGVPPDMKPVAVSHSTVDAAGVAAQGTAVPVLVLRWSSGLELTVDARSAEGIARSLLSGVWPC